MKEVELGGGGRHVVHSGKKRNSCRVWVSESEGQRPF